MSEADDITIAGPPGGEEIVLVHGTIFNRTMWAPQREKLAGDWRVIIPELPGHGTRADESFELDEAIETLEAVFDAHTDGSAHLVGLSLGGYVATAFAARNPDRVEDLVLSGSSANPVGGLGKVTYALGKLALVASKSDRIERRVSKFVADRVRDRDLGPEVTEEIIGAGFHLRPYGEAGLEIADVDFREAFSSYPGPALILNGAEDTIMRRGEQAHADAKENTQIQVVDEAGHLCNLDRPTAYTTELESFVRAMLEASG